MELCGRRGDTGQPVRVEVRADRIASVQPADPPEAASWPWIAPGLIDLQVNGYGGQEFASADLTVPRAGEVIRAFARFGLSRLCPTLTTESFEVLRHACATLGTLCDADSELARRIAGLHLEGPYITPEDGARGAHPRAHCRPPDWTEFQRLQDASGGRIRIVTLSPEYEGAVDFIRRAVQSGVTVAIGHMSATAEQVRAAVEAGARLSTHLGNGSHPYLHRFRNYLWVQLAEDRLAASLIADGHHLPPEVLRVFVRCKTPRRCILVSDLSGQAGQPPGRYSSRFCDVEILADGSLVVAGQRELMAGASLPLNHSVGNVMAFAGVDLATALRMAIDHPAALLGIEPGGIAPGKPADLIQFRLVSADLPRKGPRMEILRTLWDGRVVWDNSGGA